MTVEQSQDAIEKQLTEQLEVPQVKIKVASFNSKKIYVIAKGGGRGDSVAPLPWTTEANILHALFASGLAGGDEGCPLLPESQGGGVRLLIVFHSLITHCASRANRFRRP
jgi:hypothetical protein